MSLTSRINNILYSDEYDNNDWKVLMENTAKTEFFDELFKLLRVHLIKYYHNDESERLPRNFEKFYESDENLVIPYISVKVNMYVGNLRRTNGTNTLRYGRLVDNALREFIYFGVIPSIEIDETQSILLSDPIFNGLEIPQPRYNLRSNRSKLYYAKYINARDRDEVDIENRHFKWNYFVWLEDGDNSFHSANREEVILKFIKKNIIPNVFQQANLNVDITDLHYKRMFVKRSVIKPMLVKILKYYFHNNTLTLDNDILSSIDDMVKNKSLKSTIARRIARARNLDEHIDLWPIYEVIIEFKLRQATIRSNLKRKLARISERMVNKKSDRFKWEPICRMMDKEIKLEELRELARIDNIPFVELMSKRQLCVRLSQRISDIATIQKEYHDKCSNERSFYGGDDVNEIAPEFFFTYRHNCQTYCEDIRKLYKWITQKGPYHIDRTQLSREVVHSITEAYHKLNYTTVHMNDIVLDTEKEPEISLDSQLSSAVGDFVSKLRHATPSGFINCGEVQFNMFLEGLIEERVITINESLIIKHEKSLQEKKLKVIQILLPKIHLEDYLTFTSEVWNHTFKDGTKFDLGNKVENLLKQIELEPSIYTLNFINCDKNIFDKMLNTLEQKNVISDLDVEDINYEKSTLREAEVWEARYIKNQKSILSEAEFNESYPRNYRDVNSYDNKAHYNNVIEYNEFNFIAKKLFLVDKLMKKVSPPPVLLMNMLSSEQKEVKTKIVQENIQNLKTVWVETIRPNMLDDTSLTSIITEQSDTIPSTESETTVPTTTTPLSDADTELYDYDRFI